MERLITTKELRVGMFVVDTGVSWLDDPFIYSNEGFIKSEEQIEEILANGFLRAMIKEEESRSEEDKGKAGDNGNADEQSIVSTVGRNINDVPEFKKEYVIAREIYNESMNFSRGLVEDVRLGNKLDVGTANVVVEKMIENVMKDGSKLLCIKHLKKYDEYTFTHSVNVSMLSILLGKHMKFPAENLRILGLAGLFHDIGKVKIPTDILNKPAKLNMFEFELIKKHPEEGVIYLKDQGKVDINVLRAVFEHHEKFNGKGYPKCVKGNQISLYSKIISISDVFDALTARRAYKEPMSPSKAVNLISKMKNESFEPSLVNLFIKHMGVYPIGTLLMLSTGDIVVVLENFDDKPAFPKVGTLIIEGDKAAVQTILELYSRDCLENNIKILSVVEPSEVNVDISGIIGNA